VKAVASVRTKSAVALLRKNFLIALSVVLPMTLLWSISIRASASAVGTASSTSTSTTTTSSTLPEGASNDSTTKSTNVVVTTTTTTTFPYLRLPKTGECTILEIGDSVGTDLGGGLFTELRDFPKIHLELMGKASTGLSNEWFYNWPIHLKKFLTEFHPQLVIVMLGGNDEQGIDVDGHAAYFGEPAWQTQYAKNVVLMMKEARSAGSLVLWVGMPIMAPPGYSEGMQVINSIFEKEAKLISGVTFLPTWKYFATSKGEFQYSALVNGEEQTIREPDGIHPTVIGEDVLATLVVEKLHTIYDLAVKPAFPDVFTK